MSILDWLKKNIKSGKINEKIQLCQNGFTILRNQDSQELEWKNITSIISYKRDLITEDQVCLEIHCGEETFNLNEDFDGWELFNEMMIKRLSGLDEDWMEKVIEPAFAASQTVIYERPKSENSYSCSICGQEHDDWPALAYSSPDNFAGLNSTEKNSIAQIDDNFCVIKHLDQTDRFIRAVLVQKVNDYDMDLDYGVWVSLSEESFNDYKKNFANPQHVTSYFGWLCNNIPGYDFPDSIPTTVQTKLGNERPEIFPHRDFDHEFVKDYYFGITKDEAESRIHAMMENVG